MFDCDTGLIEAAQIGSGSLVDLAPDPSGTGQQVRVNAKGQVVEIVSESFDIAPRLGIAYFTGNGVDRNGSTLTAVGYSDLVDGYTEEIKGGPSRNVLLKRVTEYRWVVPDGVTRVKTIMCGGGGRYTASGNGYNGAYSELVLRVNPASTLIINVADGIASNASDSNTTVIGTSIEGAIGGTHYAGAQEANRVAVTQHSPGANVQINNYKGPLYPYGMGGTVDHPGGGPGLVILEWYA